MVTVTSVAHDWGFTNMGRFAAAHVARYHEAPAETLRRERPAIGGRKHRNYG